MRIAAVFKRDDRGGLKERFKLWRKRFDAFIKKIREKPGDNDSNDSNDSNNRTEDSQELPTRVKARKTWFDMLHRKKHTSNNNEPRQGAQRHVEPASQLSGGEGGRIDDNEEGGSTNSEEQTDQHKISLNNKGKSFATDDEDQISQLPAPSHPPRSTSRNVPTHAAGPGPSLQQVPSRREDLMSMTPSQSEYYTATLSDDFPQQE